VVSEQPVASPSSPSVRFTAFDAPTMMSANMATAKRCMSAMTASFTKGMYKRTQRERRCPPAPR
jgi:hypothetical protein